MSILRLANLHWVEKNRFGFDDCKRIQTKERDAEHPLITLSLDSGSQVYFEPAHWKYHSGFCIPFDTVPQVDFLQSSEECLLDGSFEETLSPCRERRFGRACSTISLFDNEIVNLDLPFHMIRKKD